MNVPGGGDSRLPAAAAGAVLLAGVRVKLYLTFRMPSDASVAEMRKPGVKRSLMGVVISSV